MNIVIPTWGRPESQPAYDAFEAAGYEPILAVDKKTDAGGRRHVVLRHKFLYQVRQKILDKFPGKVLSPDDDLRFFRRTKDNKFVKATNADICKMVGKLDKALDTYAHASIPPRFMAQVRNVPFDAALHGASEKRSVRIQSEGGGVCLP